VAGPLTNSAVSISNGLFTVALDFGAVFDGTAQWLQIDVRSTGAGPFTSLAPRQALTAVPYALTANMAANLAGALPATQLSGTVPLEQLPGTLLTNGQAGVSLAGAFGGNAAGLTNLNAGSLASGTVPLARLPDQGFALPQMFGAVGDGVTDDTLALQAWINYCSSNRLEARLPAARVYYAISNWLMITNPLTIRGPGDPIHFPGGDSPARAHIRQTSPAAGAFLIQGSPYYSALIPTNAIGNNGTLRASCLLSANGSTGVEVRYFYGNTLMASFTGPPGYNSLFGMREIANRNALNSQISFPTGSPAVCGSAS
jgi:hypothetical protein